MWNKTLKQVMPEILSKKNGEYCKTKAYKMLDEKVITEHGDITDFEPESWRGPHRHVYFWVELENGYAVGWNQNPTRGWSFPVMKLDMSEKENK